MKTYPTWNNLSDDLTDYFIYLTDTDNYRTLLRSIMKQAKSVQTDADHLRVEFLGGHKMIATPPTLANQNHLPESFKALGIKHELITFDDHIILGNHDLFDYRWLEDFESRLLNVTDPRDIVSPVRCYDDCWIYHPTETNDRGEPKIYFLSHEGPDISNPQTCNAGELFLKLIAEVLGIETDKLVDPGFAEQTELTEHESLNLRPCSLRMNLADGHIIELCQSRLAILRFNNNTFDVVSEFTGIPLTSGARIQLFEKKAFVYLNNLGCCLFDISNHQIKLLQRIEIDSRWNAVTYFNKALYYHQTSAPKGFLKRSFAQKGEVTIIRRDEPYKHLFIEDSVIFDNLILFVGQNTLIGFKIEEGSPPTEAFKIKASYRRPRALKISNNHFLIFDRGEDAIALTVYKFNKKPEMISGLEEGESAIAWQVKGNNVWLLTLDKSKRYIFNCYSFDGVSMNLKSKTVLKILTNQEDHLITIERIIATESNVVLLNWDQRFWKMDFI